MWWTRWFGKRAVEPPNEPPPSHPHEPATREHLPTLNKLLEMGMCDNAILNKMFSELDSMPETLLPDAMPVLAHTSFLLWKSGRGEFAKRLLFTCLAWFLKHSTDCEEISTIAKNLLYVFEKEGQSFSEEDIRRLAASGRFGHAESWRLGVEGFNDPKQIVEIADGKVTSQRTRYAAGFAPSVSSKLPLTTFHGFLKRLDPAVLNQTGRLVTEHVFPMFAEFTAHQYLARAERLAAMNIALSAGDQADIALLRSLVSEGQEVKLRRHRRYSGGDGLLPRGCYSSVCKNAAGDDGGSLNRELFAYVDSRVPGVVYVDDSTSARLNQTLGASLKIMPGFCAIYVLLIAPQEPAEKVIFDSIYAPLLDRTGGEMLNVFAFEARVDECTIENVIDLRLPQTQQWFFDHFKNGDGHFLIKDCGTAREFYDLLPTLMHPALGGSDVTHAVGSWMRSSGVSGLVFPSARSNASVTIEEGELADWHGWNFVDYRTAAQLPATEVTNSKGGWLDFLQPGAKLAVASGRLAGSWQVIGLQDRYDNLREQIEDALGGGGGHVSVVSPGREPPSEGPVSVPDIGPAS